MRREYKVNTVTLVAIRALKRMNAQFTRILLPGANHKAHKAETPTFIGAAEKVSPNGEVYSVPLIFGGNVTTEEDVKIIVTSAQFERAMDTVALVSAEDGATLIADDEQHLLTVKAGTSVYELTYYVEGTVKIGTGAELIEKQVELTCETLALQARIASMRPFTKNFVELRASADGTLKVIGEITNSTVPYSVFNTDEVKATYDATVLQTAEEQAEQAKADKTKLEADTLELSFYGYSFLIPSRYIGLLSENIYGKKCKLELYRNGFKFSSNGSVLIGLCGEKSAIKRAAEKQLAMFSTNSKAYDFVVLAKKEELKKLTSLTSLWEQDIVEKTAGKKAVPVVKAEFRDGKLNLSMTDMQTYTADVKVKDNKPEVHKDAATPTSYFHKETLMKALSAMNDELTFMCFALTRGKTVLYLRDGHYSDEEGKKTMAHTGNHVYVSSIAEEQYTNMCAAVANVGAPSEESEDSNE